MTDQDRERRERAIRDRLGEYSPTLSMQWATREDVLFFMELEAAHQRERVAELERKRIATWLRNLCAGPKFKQDACLTFNELADAIEDGEHILRSALTKYDAEEDNDATE